MLKDNLTGCYCNLFVFPRAIEYATAIIIPMMVCTSTEAKRLKPIIFLLSVKPKEIISELGIVVCDEQSGLDLGIFVEFNFLPINRNF